MQSISQTLGALNPIAVAISTLTIVLIHAFWYSRFLFGRAWIRMSGIRPGDVSSNEAGRRIIYRIIMAFVTAVLLGCAADYTNSFRMLATMVIFIWLFVMLDQLNGFIWRREPFAFFLLQVLCSFFALLGGASIFMFWS